MFHPCLFFWAGRAGNTCQTLHQDRSCYYFEKGLVPKESVYPMYNRNLVQLWVGLWCVRHDLWHQWLLSDSVTWQQRWTNWLKVDFGLWKAILDAECNLFRENWFWTLRLFLGCWFVLICSDLFRGERSAKGSHWRIHWGECPGHLLSIWSWQTLSHWST